MKLTQFKDILKQTSPIMITYFFLSIILGLLIKQKHLSLGFGIFSSTFIYTGAFQFILVSLYSRASMLSIFITCFMMNSRMFFYGLTYSKDFYQGLKKIYQIHTLTDETYALNMNLKKNENYKVYFFYAALLSHLSWILGTIVGYFVGEMLPSHLEGLDFCMTAMFVTILIDILKNKESHFPCLLAFIIGMIGLIYFKANFMLISLLICLGILIGKEKMGC